MPVTTKRKPKHKVWKGFVAAGLVCIMFAFGLVVYNFYDDTRAGEFAENVINSLSDKIDGYTTIDEDNKGVVKTVDNHGITYPDYLLNPDMPMPTKKIDGKEYAAVIKIPKLNLQLPVMSEWSYDNLRDAPCIYSGSAYKGNLVIAAHNYTKHFGSLKSLNTDDIIKLTDMSGNVFTYKVLAMETLEPTQVKEMKTANADLSLFTCTIGGQFRVTVRCEQIDKITI